MRVLITILAALFTLTSGNFDQPISPTSYSAMIKQGFSTNYFKTQNPLSRYKTKNTEDVLDAGFSNLRLRCRADLHPATDDTTFDPFLDDLETVVDDCLTTGIIPIISWINHHAEAYANETDREEYVMWWTKVAHRLKDKDYRLSFNLFTELGYTGCEPNNYCPDSLRENTDKYNNWTWDVVSAIRSTTGNNPNRILILASPGKTGKDLPLIDQNIYQNDNYMMVEWHTYASGPNKNTLNNGKKSGKYWLGDGSEEDKQRVKDYIKEATDFTATSSILSYLGAWMPLDNKDGALNQSEVISFGCYFAGQLKDNNIPWSMNVLDDYYKTKTNEWITSLQEIPKNKNQWLNMSTVLNEINNCM